MRHLLLILTLAFAWIFCVVPSEAALTSDTVWEVRRAGDVTNGGCYDTGASGTDYSQQDVAQVTYSDLVIGVTTTEVTSVSDPFGATSVGNCISIIAGVGCTISRRQVVSVSVVTATLDDSAGTAGSTCDAKLGGALGGISAWGGFQAQVLPGNTIYIKADATYTNTATIAALTVPGTTALPIKWIGYTTTRGDGGNAVPGATFTSATNSVALVTLNAAHYNQFYHLKFTHTAATRGICVSFVTADSDFVSMDHILFDGCLNGVSLASTADDFSLTNSTILNTTGHCVTQTTSNQNFYGWNMFYNCGAGAGTFHGINVAAASATSLKVTGNMFVSASGDGISITNASGNPEFTAIGNGFKDNGSDGIAIGLSAIAGRSVLANNIFWSNGAYGFTTAGLSDQLITNFNNAYGDNGTDARNNLSAGTGDVTITVDPWTDCDASLVCTLNNTAGGGAALRATGIPGAFGGVGNTSTTGYPDIGPVQHQDAGGSTTILVPGGPVGF